MINSIHNTNFIKQSLELSTEWIPVQVYESKTEHSNPLCLCPGLQMYQSEFGGLQGRAIASYIFQGGVAQMYIRM